MKRITNLIALFLMVICGATAQINTPQPSPSGSVSSVVGLTEIKIDYFRPGVKGREVFGEGSDFLVPYGQIWRTGANAGSILSLSTEAKIGGKDVKAGEYQIVTKPGAGEWEVMLLNEMIGGNMTKYKEDIVAAKFSVRPQSTNEYAERMSFQIAHISKDNKTADIKFSWDNVILYIPVEVSFHETVMADIKKNTQVDPRNYTAAANYYLSVNENLEQALEWMNLYLSTEGNSGQFWHVHTKARILAAMGNKKEAIATAKDSMEKAKNNSSGDFGYVKRNEDLINSLK